MSGALVGFKIDGERKLLRLHGERSCEGVLTELLDYLRATSDARLGTYARGLKMVVQERGPCPDDVDRAELQPFLDANPAAPAALRTWTDIFGAFAELQGWHAGLPFMPAALLTSCGDVSWGFLIDLDAWELQIFVNRHARYAWCEMGGSQPAYCSMALDHARLLTRPDLSALQALLQQHAYAESLDVALPLHDAVSPPFAGPGEWQAMLQLTGGHVHLRLRRGTVQARLTQVGELTLDHPHGGALLREALDPAVQAMVQAIYGPGANLAQIARVAAHLSQLPFAPDEGGLPLLDLALRPSCGLALALGPSFFDRVRAQLLASGMSGQGWRFLIKQDDAVLRSLLQFFPPSARILASFSHFINLLASALQSTPLRIERCQPALRGVERILDRTRGRPDQTREENARIFLRAVMRVRLSDAEESNLAHEAQDVSDFVYAHTAVLKGATWKSLHRRSDEWHRALLISVDPDKDVRWPALLPVFETGQFLAVELNTGLSLAEEGLEQRHCIGTYANACASGATRVFSLRHHGRRAATLELQRRHDGSWRMVQIRGKANSAIREPALLDAANQLVQAYAQAARAHAGQQRPRVEEIQAPCPTPQPAHGAR